MNITRRQFLIGATAATTVGVAGIPALATTPAPASFLEKRYWKEIISAVQPVMGSQVFEYKDDITRAHVRGELWHPLNRLQIHFLEFRHHDIICDTKNNTPEHADNGELHLHIVVVAHEGEREIVHFIQDAYGFRYFAENDLPILPTSVKGPAFDLRGYKNTRL